jgi:hypothetical protein
LKNYTFIRSATHLLMEKRIQVDLIKLNPNEAIIFETVW